MDAPAWSICRDSLEPLAQYLNDLACNWRRVRYQRPEPREIERVFQKHRLDDVMEWLRIKVSMEFAEDLQRELFGPLRKYHKLVFRACRILDKGWGSKARTCRLQRGAVVRLLDEILPAARRAQAQGEQENVTVWKHRYDAIADADLRVEQGFQRAAERLTRAVNVLRQQEQQAHIALTTEDRTILEALCREGCMTVTQEDLAGVTKISVGTVKTRLKHLRHSDLVHQPCGPKKGFTATDRGRALIGPLP